MEMVDKATKSGKGEPEGRELASFECRARSESISRAVLPGGMAIFAAIASSLSDPDIMVVLLVIIALLPVIAAIVSTLFPRTPSMCTITENGIRLKALKPAKARSRFLPWRNLARFSSKPLGFKGGRIYLYPKGPFSFLRREVIEPLQMSDFQLLFNYVSTRIGIF